MDKISKELAEMNGREMRAFSTVGRTYFTTPTTKYFLQIEERAGDGAYVKHFYIIEISEGVETARWNFHNVEGVFWGGY